MGGCYIDTTLKINVLKSYIYLQSNFNLFIKYCTISRYLALTSGWTFSKSVHKQNSKQIVISSWISLHNAGLDYNATLIQ